MELLQQAPDRGYPVEYLLSRIRGRRSRLIRDWRSLVYDPALQERLGSGAPGTFLKGLSPLLVWRGLLREHTWVYAQMNKRLRAVFYAYFLYAELRTVVIGLRFRRDAAAGNIDELLNASLLSESVKETLATGTDLPSTVAGIERLFASCLSERFRGLRAVLDEGGLRGVEQRIVETYLAVIADSGLDPLMARFFARLIDARNIMSRYKYLRLEPKTPPMFIPGGNITEARMKEVIDKEDLAGISTLVREYAGVTIDRPDPTAVELALYRSITRWLRKEGRDPFGVAPLLDYLWRCSIEAMNLSVLYQGKDLEREVVAAELVQ